MCTALISFPNVCSFASTINPRPPLLLLAACDQIACIQCSKYSYLQGLETEIACDTSRRRISVCLHYERAFIDFVYKGKASSPQSTYMRLCGQRERDNKEQRRTLDGLPVLLHHIASSDDNCPFIPSDDDYCCCCSSVDADTDRGEDVSNSMPW